jgi:hypothetical protein
MKSKFLTNSKPLVRILRITSLILVFSILNSSFLTIQMSDASSLGTISSNEAFAVYMDAPYVQGSYIASQYPGSTSTDTYDNISQDNNDCPSTGNVGSYSFAAGTCKVLTSAHDSNHYVYGGALTTTETPTTSGTQSPSVGIYGSTGTTITLASSANYLGMWWSAGSLQNQIQFYQNSALVLTLSVDDICAMVRASGSCTAPSDNSTITAIDSSTTYLKRNYYGHPLNQSWDSSEPFVYIHVFAQNNITFNKIKITASSSYGFEMDNLSVGNINQPNIKSSLIAVKSYGTTHYLSYDTRGGQRLLKVETFR